MKRRAVLTCASLMVLLSVSCSPAKSGSGESASADSFEAAKRSCAPTKPLASSDFTNPTKIDNTWFPLVPGTTFVLEGRANRGGGPLPHRVEFTVTDMTKEIAGINTVVMWDRDFNEGRLAEEELAFHAQDNAGNVWNLGEYPEEYEDGKFTGAPSTWIAGKNDAEAGVLVPGKPEIRRPFLQGAVADVEFLDCAEVVAVGASVCAPIKCFSNVLRVEEWSPLEPDTGRQRKEYGPGAGVAVVGAIGDKEGETLVLTRIVHLDTAGLAEARAAVQRLEKRAFETNEIYRGTAAATQAPAATR